MGGFLFFNPFFGKLRFYKRFNLMKQQQKNMVEEPLADYAKAELDLLKAGLKRSHTERFLMMTNLMKRNIMFSKADIRHKYLHTPE